MSCGDPIVSHVGSSAESVQGTLHRASVHHRRVHVIRSWESRGLKRQGPHSSLTQPGSRPVWQLPASAPSQP